MGFWWGGLLDREFGRYWSYGWEEFGLLGRGFKIIGVVYLFLAFGLGRAVEMCTCVLAISVKKQSRSKDESKRLSILLMVCDVIPHGMLGKCPVSARILNPHLLPDLGELL